MKYIQYSVRIYVQPPSSRSNVMRALIYSLFTPYSIYFRMVVYKLYRFNNVLTDSFDAKCFLNVSEACVNFGQGPWTICAFPLLEGSWFGDIWGQYGILIRIKLLPSLT